MNEENQQDNILLSVSFNQSPNDIEFLSSYEKTTTNAYQKVLQSQSELSVQLQLLSKFSNQINNINYSANSVECLYNQKQAPEWYLIA